MTHLVNKTPHPIMIPGYGEIPPTLPPARLVEEKEDVGVVPIGRLRIPLIKKRFGNVIDLPASTPMGGHSWDDETMYIVSLPVAQAVAGKREDVITVGEYIRDEKGNVVGAKSFAMF